MNEKRLKRGVNPAFFPRKMSHFGGRKRPSGQKTMLKLPKSYKVLAVRQEECRSAELNCRHSRHFLQQRTIWARRGAVKTLAMGEFHRIFKRDAHWWNSCAGKWAIIGDDQGNMVILCRAGIRLPF